MYQVSMNIKNGVSCMIEKNQKISFRFGDKVIKINKKKFKYALIIIVGVFVLLPYMNLTMPTHFLTTLK